jgi:polysaccharide deacetylase 2 family uncharacterized protein YibQ
MRKNELNQPIDRKIDTPAPRRRPFIAPLLISAALIIAVVAAFWVAVVDDPDGGRPVVIAKIEDAVPAETGSVAPDAGEAALPGPATVPADASVTPGASTSATSDEMQLAALPQLPPAVAGDPSLLEYSNFGALPRVSPDGRRPREVYARRAAPVPEGVAKIVIVVGGLGLSQTGTQKALDTLPEDITLAFAPYGSSLQRWVGKARDAGHEVLLQIPLEPLDYPSVNPGEHTLVVSGGAANRQDLEWSLGRMTSYAGVMNHMGARFTSDEKALVPFLGEIGERGLFYLDDGSSSQSLAASIGKALAVPVLTADRVVDEDRSPEAIVKQLMALEAIAHARGVAIGVASAFPASIEAIARWANDAQARGIVIVPASGAINSKADAG